MNANFEQAYNILQTLNIDLQGFNNYLINILKADAIKMEVKEVAKKIDNKQFSIIFPTTKAKWGDYEDEDATSIISDTTSIISDTTSTTCSISETASIPSTLDVNSKSLNYLSVVSGTSMESDGFKQPISKKTQRKHVILNASTNPMFKNYGLSEDQTVFDKKDMSIAIKEKWIIGTDFQIHTDAFCPTMMEGCNCKGHCDYVHLFHCKFETESKKCTNSKCTFLHSRDMITKEARANFQRNLKKC